MDAEPPQDESLSLKEWLALLRETIGSNPALQLAPGEERELLALARIAAHRSERIAAPLTTFILGLALADVPTEQRPSRIADVTRRLAADQRGERRPEGEP